MKRMIPIAGLCSLAVSPLSALTLSEGVPINGLSATTGQSLDFDIAVPDGARNLSIAMSGGTGDADLYVKAGALPSVNDHDCGPYLSGNTETCEFSAPLATTYYAKVVAYRSFSQLSLTASYDSAGTTTETQVLHNGSTRQGLAQTSGAEARYRIALPDGAKDLEVEISGGSGDADLYLRALQAPTTTQYDCRPYLTGNQEQCAVAAPVAGDYHIMLRAYSDYSGVTLAVHYTESGQDDGGDDASTWSGFQSYYADAIGQTGSALISALSEAASRGQLHLSYSQVWDALKYTDEDPDYPNNVLLIYTGRSQAKSFNASGNNDPDAWNREHTWPKSHGFPDSGD
ncbi:MAG: pre-peptidase C-terminal domain-containing protein [Candidatus Thiodiazotropha sp.]